MGDFSASKLVTLSPGDGIVMTLLRKDGTPYNLLQWSSRAQIRNPLNQLVSEFAITIIDAARGVIRMNLPNPGAVNALPAGDYIFNVLLWQGTNEDRLSPMRLRILEPVTVQPPP